jgi:uncharacterized membrane protein
MWILRTLMLLALVAWVGGIIFFAFVLAPTLFTVLPPQVAGNVVSPSLTKLHWIGLVAGAVFLACSLAYNKAKHGELRLFGASQVMILVMLILTAISQFAITPRMRELRSSSLSLDAMSASAQFDRLHKWSTRLEGGVLILGLMVVVLKAKESN